MPGVVIKGLTKRYGGVSAVEGLDLEVKPGELVSLLVPSGCGKTTTLRLVAGFLKPEAGEIWVGDRCLSSPAPGELSGGQQQRVAVARALVVEPEILLLDEPLSNLDANLREEMRFEIRRLHETFAITTLYVTHDQAEAMVISDRVAVLQDGRVVQVGTADELFERPRTRFVAEFIGKTNLIDGIAEGTGTVARGRLRLRVASADLTPGAPVAVSIRPHQIELAPRGPPRAPAAPDANA